MDPWEKFQALKAADKLTMMNGKLRESSRWADQVYLDPWEKYQALRAADKLTATRRPRTRGTDQLKSDIHRPREREDVRVTSTPRESLTTPFVNSRRPVDTPDHVTSLGYNGVYQPRTMQTESRGLSTLYYSGNFARETGLHTLQQQRLHGSTGPFSEVEDWFASKYMRAPKQELYKSSAKLRTSTQDILGVYPSSYGAHDFTDRSSTGTDTESIDAESTDDTSSDVSEISYRFNSIDELSEDSDSTIPNWYKAVEIGLHPLEPQKSTTVHQLYNSTLPISGGYKGKSQSTNVTVSHILGPKQDNPCVQKCTDDLTVYRDTNTVTDKSSVSAEQQKTSTEGDVNGHPSSPEIQNNIDDLLTLTEPMPSRAMDDTVSYVPKLIYPLDSTGPDELSDDCESIVTETVDIPKSETKESSTNDKTSNVEDFDKKREGTSKYEHLVDSDNPDLINSFTFKYDVKPTEQESLESNVSPPIPQTEDTLREIPASVSDTLRIEKKITEQVISMPETPEAQGYTMGRDISTQTEQDALEQKQVKEEIASQVVPRELTRSSSDAAFPETSSEGRTSYSRHVLSRDERGQDRETESQQAFGERSTVCEITELRCSEINGQSNRPTDRSNLEIFNKVKQDIKDTGSNIKLEKIQTTDDQEVTDKENKNRAKEEERVKINTMEIEEAPRKNQVELTNERIDNNLDEFRKKVEEQITADQKVNDTESKNKHEKEEECVKRNILETEETLRQEDTGLGYDRIEKYLEEFKKKLEEQYVGSRPDTSFVRGGDINVTVQCGVMNTKHVLPPTGNQPVSTENATSAYRKDGHENGPRDVYPQTGPWVDKRSTRQTRHIKKCRNCGSTRLDTVSESSGLISGTSVSQRSPRFLIDSMQADPSAYWQERGRERTAHSPVSAEQSIVHDKACASNTTRIGGQRELQQRKSRPQKLRYGEVDPCATDPEKKTPSRKAIKEGVPSPPITSQSPLSRPTETKETDAKLEREERKGNVFKRKKSEDKYKVGSENEPGSAKSKKETIKPSHSNTVKPRDDFTDIFVTETAEYECPSSDEANETSSRPKDSLTVEASSVISTGSINSDNNDIIGRKNVNVTEIKPEASPKAHRDKSSSTSGESGDSTDYDHKSKRKIVGKSGTRLKRSTEPTKTTEASPKTHRDKSSSTSGESYDSTDYDHKSKRKIVGKSGTRLKRSTEPTKTTEASPKTHRDKSSSTSSESDDSTDSDPIPKRKRTWKSGSRLKRSTEPTKTTEASPKTHRDKSSSTSSESNDSTDSDSISRRKRTGKYGSRVKRSTEHTKTRKPEASPKTHKDRSSSTSSDSDDSTDRTKTSEVKKERETGSKKDVKSKRKSRNLPPVTSTSTVELTDQRVCDHEVKQITQDSEPSPISSNSNEDSESTDDDPVASSLSTTEINSESETEDNDDDEKEDNKQNNDDKLNEKEKRKNEIAELKKKLEEVKKTDKSEKHSQENQKKEQKTMEKLDKELDKKRKEIEKVNLKREQRQIKKEKDEEKNALKEQKKLQKIQMKREKEEMSTIKKKAKKAENGEKKLEKLRNEIKKVEYKQASKNQEIEQTQTNEYENVVIDGDANYDDGCHIVNANNDDFDDIVEGDDEDKQTKADIINLKEKRKKEIAELKKKLEEVKKIDKSEKGSQEYQKKEQKTMKKLDKELDKKRKEIEKVNLKREQRQIKKEKDEEKNALKEEKKLQKMQTKQEKEEQSKIKKEAKKDENEEKKLEKLRNEIKKVEDKQASKKIEQNHTDENDDDDDDDDDDDRCYVSDHIVNDTFSDSDEGENKQTERGEMDGKVEVKNKIAELKEKLEEGKRLEKAEKRSRESQKKDEQEKKKLDKKQEREKNKLEEVARKKELQRIKDERNKNVKLLQEKKKFLEKQIKQKKKEQAKIQKEAKKATKDAEERKKSKKTQKDAKKKEQKKALKKEEKHSNANDDKDDLDPKVNECDSDQNDDEGSDDENKQTKSETMIEHADVIQNEIAELKEELEEVIMTEETQKRQIKSDEKNEQAIEKLDKEMEREKKKMEEIDRKLELKQKKIEKDEEKKMLKEEKKISEKLMKEEKKEQSRNTKEEKKAEKEKEKGRKKAEKEVEKERKKAEQEKEKQRKKAEKEQKDAQKKEEKEAKKAAEKEQKESAKVVKEREKEQKEKEKREKMRKKKEQQKEKKREKEKQKEESKLLAFRRKKELERQSRMKKAEEQKEKEEMKRKAAEKEAAQKEEINKIKKERKREKERWKAIEKRDKITLKHEKEDRKIEQEQREHEQILLKIRNGLKHGNQSLAEDSQDEITKDESSLDTSSSDSEQEITQKRPLSNKPSPVIPAEDCENEYMEIFQNCASNESDKPCDGFAPDSFGHLTVRDHDDKDDNDVRSRQYQQKEKKINLVVEFQKYLARKARSQESEEASISVSNQAPSGNSKTDERGLSLPSCTESQHIIEAEEKSDVHQNSQTSEQLEELTLPSQEKDKTKHPYHHSLNEDLSKSALNTSRNPGVDQPAKNKDRGKGAHTGSSENPRTQKILQRHASRDKSDKKAAGAKSRDNPSLSDSTQKVTRTSEAVRSIVHGKKVYDSMNKTRTAKNDRTGSGYHSWDDSDEEIEIEKKTSVINLDQRRGIEVDFVPDGGHNSWDDSDEETEVQKKPSIMKLNEMKGIDVEFVPEYSYNSWDDTDDEDTIEHEIKDVMGENLDIYEPKPTPPVEEKKPDILADPILKELYGDLYEDVCGVKDEK